MDQTSLRALLWRTELAKELESSQGMCQRLRLSLCSFKTSPGDVIFLVGLASCPDRSERAGTIVGTDLVLGFGVSGGTGHVCQM